MVDLDEGGDVDHIEQEFFQARSTRIKRTWTTLPQTASCHSPQTWTMVRIHFGQFHGDFAQARSMHTSRDSRSMSDFSSSFFDAMLLLRTWRREKKTGIITQGPFHASMRPSLLARLSGKFFDPGQHSIAASGNTLPLSAEKGTLAFEHPRD